MKAILEDTNFWVLLSFVLFIVAVWKPAAAAILGGLDTRAKEIKKRLDEAETLKNEAQALLAQFQRRQRDAAREAEEIVSTARSESAHLREQGQKHLADTIARRERLALDKIAQAEANAILEIRRLVADVATAATARALEAGVSKSRHAALIDEAVKGIAKPH
ncbi:MAG: F0F1 ATP synthase subunit B [Alphaproteobacteria bacterium]|nr:F0F1 ATP synthase subunit B [Alphaproteobacteria bacterium]